jgi:hypothetical protein
MACAVEIDGVALSKFCSASPDTTAARSKIRSGCDATSLAAAPVCEMSMISSRANDAPAARPLAATSAMTRLAIAFLPMC